MVRPQVGFELDGPLAQLGRPPFREYGGPVRGKSARSWKTSKTVANHRVAFSQVGATIGASGQVTTPCRKFLFKS